MTSQLQYYVNCFENEVNTYENIANFESNWIEVQLSVNNLMHLVFS